METKWSGLPADVAGVGQLHEHRADDTPTRPRSVEELGFAQFDAPSMGWVDHLWEPRGLLRRFHGIVSLAQVGQSDVEVQASPQFDEIRYLIDDFRSCTNLVDIDLAQIDELAAIAAVAVRHPEIFRHAVVSSLPAVQELAQEFTHSGFGAYPVKHFDQLAEARQWAMG